MSTSHITSDFVKRFSDEQSPGDNDAPQETAGKGLFAVSDKEGGITTTVTTSITKGTDRVREILGNNDGFNHSNASDAEAEVDLQPAKDQFNRYKEALSEGPDDAETRINPDVNMEPAKERLNQYREELTISQTTSHPDDEKTKPFDLQPAKEQLQRYSDAIFGGSSTARGTGESTEEDIADQGNRMNEGNNIVTETSPTGMGINLQPAKDELDRFRSALSGDTMSHDTSTGFMDPNDDLRRQENLKSFDRPS
ncbi:hypothetical protein FRC03_010984 [Tulasnella sp. 419]|nr:hypothetical protein FRC03_010984 [Tulasnella sp. 419]